MKPIKTRLLLPEYGRNVQKMVRYLKTIEDRELRNAQARVVVAVMGNVYPYRRDSEEFRHMLWDHLFMIADFDIDVDAPYPHPTPEMFQPRPERVSYSQHPISQRHYGDNWRRMVQNIVKSDAGDEQKERVIANIASIIRQQSYNFNKEYPSNEVIVNDLQQACGEDFTIDPAMLSGTKVEVRPYKIPNNRNNNKLKNRAKKLKKQ